MSSNASLGASHGLQRLATQTPTTLTPRSEDGSDTDVSESPSAAPASDGLRAALVGHSISGWLARMLLGKAAAYDGRRYGAAGRVHTLVSLGTPHTSSEGFAARNLAFVNENYPGTSSAPETRFVSVAGKRCTGKTSLGGLWKDFAYLSYEMTCGDGTVWGDGVTPVQVRTGCGRDIERRRGGQRRGGGRGRGAGSRGDDHASGACHSCFWSPCA